MVGVSGRLVTAAEKLLREAPGLAEKVRAGEAKLAVPKTISGWAAPSPVHPFETSTSLPDWVASFRRQTDGPNDQR